MYLVNQEAAGILDNLSKNDTKHRSDFVLCHRMSYFVLCLAAYLSSELIKGKINSKFSIPGKYEVQYKHVTFPTCLFGLNVWCYTLTFLTFEYLIMKLLIPSSYCHIFSMNK
jgi:hypothetical protein